VTGRGASTGVDDIAVGWRHIDATETLLRAAAEAVA
jgi:hypothetical protein